jgi:hypothetical protein
VSYDFRFTCPRCKRTTPNENDVRAGYCPGCHDWTGQGTCCPGCGQHARLQIIGSQAMCGNEDCRVVMWDPNQPLLDQEWGEIDLSRWPF